MATNSRKHRLRLFQSYEPAPTLYEALERAERRHEWYKVYFRVGGHLRNDPQLMKLLWRSKKQRNIQKSIANKRK